MKKLKAMKVYWSQITMERLLVICFVPFLWSGVTLAQSEGHAIAGAGASSCGTYLEASSDRELSMIYVTWAQGYLSGVNVAQNALTNAPWVLLPDAATIKAYVQKYCRDNPLGTPATGVSLLFFEIRNQQKPKEEPEKKSIPN